MTTPSKRPALDDAMADDSDRYTMRCSMCGSTNLVHRTTYYSLVADIPGIEAYANRLGRCCSPTCLYSACVMVLPPTRPDLIRTIKTRIEQYSGEGACQLVQAK